MKKLYKTIIETAKGEIITEMFCAKSVREIKNVIKDGDTLLNALDKTPCIDFEKLSNDLTEKGYTSNDILYIISNLK